MGQSHTQTFLCVTIPVAVLEFEHVLTSGEAEKFQNHPVPFYLTALPSIYLSPLALYYKQQETRQHLQT